MRWNSYTRISITFTIILVRDIWNSVCLITFLLPPQVQAVAWNHYVPQILLTGSFDHSVVMVKCFLFVPLNCFVTTNFHLFNMPRRCPSSLVFLCIAEGWKDTFACWIQVVSECWCRKLGLGSSHWALICGLCFNLISWAINSKLF